MTALKPEEPQAGQIVLITATSSVSQGLVGKLFKVLSVDFPYGVLLWLESTVQTRHTEDLRQYTFAIPEKGYIEAAIPNEAWPDVVG